MGVCPWHSVSTVNDHLGTNPGGGPEAVGLLVDPSLAGVVSCQVLHHQHGGDTSNSRFPSHEANAWAGCSATWTLEGRILHSGGVPLGVTSKVHALFFTPHANHLN